MHLRPRHYILLALIVILGAYNLMRLRRRPQMAPANVARHTLPSGPRPESPAWNAFDRAAGLRDTTDQQFAPALEAFHQQRAKLPQPDEDLRGCSTWLEFYRQGVLHPSRDPAWHNRSTEHLDSCTKYHRDLSS